MEQRVSLVNTLRLVNNIRVTLGKKPLKKMPKGIQEDACECPVAAALNATFNYDTIDFHSDVVARKVAAALHIKRYDTQVLAPATLRGFAVQFDAGYFPELQA